MYRESIYECLELTLLLILSKVVQKHSLHNQPLMQVARDAHENPREESLERNPESPREREESPEKPDVDANKRL